MLLNVILQLSCLSFFFVSDFSKMEELHTFHIFFQRQLSSPFYLSFFGYNMFCGYCGGDLIFTSAKLDNDSCSE